MAERFNIVMIPAHRAFLDTLASGLLGKGGSLELARTTVLLPNRRAVRSLTEAFVRIAGGALLLPRMLAIGDVAEDEALGLFDDLMMIEADVAPPVDAFERLMLLMPLVNRWQANSGRVAAAVETLRLADALARTLDHLQLDEIALPRLEEAGNELGKHWQKTVDFLGIVVRQWPLILAAAGKTDRVVRRQSLLRAVATRWAAAPPERRIVAAGMASADPAAAALLRVIAGLPRGTLVLPGLDMETQDWDLIGDAPSHPQASMRQLLDRIGAVRDDVGVWPETSERDGTAHKSSAIAAALALPATTAIWTEPIDIEGLNIVEAANPAEEATVIALAMRRQLETPGASAALVTPDRALARRVAAKLARWNIEIDDSAGTPLGRTPPGTLLIAAIEAGVRRFSPVALLALLKHPLAGPEDETERARWRDGVRRLDLALRGVRPAAGLKGISARLSNSGDSGQESLETWWKTIESQLKPLETLLNGPVTLAASAEALRVFATAFSGDRLWRGEAGRAAAGHLADLISYGDTPGTLAPADLPALYAALADRIAVRPRYGKHPRLAIYGLLEARLQRADLMILGGMNEGIWPAAPHFDPWLPPLVRRKLGLPESERATGLAAHDFISAAGAAAVLLTRARRDASAPTVPSRFWLRLTAFCGDRLASDAALLAAARGLDARLPVKPASPPRIAPPYAARPKQISITQVDRLRADPFSFYAQRILKLKVLDPLDADPTAADKGTLVHAMLESLIAGGSLFDAAARAAAIDMALTRHAGQPLLEALWRPRVSRMLEWVADRLAERRDTGWQESHAERKGRMTVAGIELTGRADIVQCSADGLAIADFKTGRLPSGDQIGAGFALQLGLLAGLAEAGVLDGVNAAAVRELAYWKLSGGETPGEAKSTVTNFKTAWGDVPAFIAMCRSVFEAVAAKYLTGTAPFEAKVFPEYALHMHDYDHLARLAEWQGRA